jgi:hypothetical protein
VTRFGPQRLKLSRAGSRFAAVVAGLHLGRCYLKGRDGDAANIILTAVGYNLRLVLAWLREFLRLLLIALLRTFAGQSTFRSAC